MYYSTHWQKTQEIRDQVWGLVDSRRANGLNCMPIHLDGSRKPMIKWSEYQVTKISDYDAQQMFKKDCGIGVICGATSGNLEILDFDDATCWRPFWKLAHSTKKLLGICWLIVTTPSGGYHVYYRCADVGRNLQLAYNANNEIRIETRGQGGYAVMPDSPLSIHATGLPYKKRSGWWDDIPKITPEQRTILLETARTFDLRPSLPSKPEKVKREGEAKNPAGSGGLAPWVAFNLDEEITWESILDEVGWSHHGLVGNVDYWTRPGKTSGVSASTGFCVTDDGVDLLHVFSSNAAPFEAEGNYSKAAAFTHLFCSGDFRRSAKILRSKGFGIMNDDIEERLDQIIKGSHNEL